LERDFHHLLIGGEAPSAGLIAHQVPCFPLDCADNQLALVMTQNDSNVTVKIVSENATGGQPRYFGTSDPKLLSILDSEHGR
jgi:hypothetical protein